MIRFIQPWRQYAPGDTTEALDEGIAATLVSRAIAEPVEPRGFLRAAKDKMVRREKVKTKGAEE